MFRLLDMLSWIQQEKFVQVVNFHNMFKETIMAEVSTSWSFIVDETIGTLHPVLTLIVASTRFSIVDEAGLTSKKFSISEI